MISSEPDGDAGFTLIDLVVTMVILGIVMILFTAGIMQIYGAEDRTESASTSQTQLVTAFQRLDKEIRYSSGISTPGTVGSDNYVEFISTYTGSPVCTELRLHAANKELQQRTWTEPSPMTSSFVPTPSAWIPLASTITAWSPSTKTGLTPPFTLTLPGTTFDYQRLEVTLTATFGTNSTKQPKQSDITFTALNTSHSTSSSTTCTEGRSVA